MAEGEKWLGIPKEYAKPVLKGLGVVAVAMLAIAGIRAIV